MKKVSLTISQGALSNREKSEPKSAGILFPSRELCAGEKASRIAHDHAREWPQTESGCI